MAQKPPHTCRYPGCPNIVRTPYCSEHAEYEKAVKSDYEKRRTDKEAHGNFYGKAVWQKARKMYASRHPLCEDCLERGYTVEMEIVDHIEEILDGGERLSEQNFRSLCRSCHAIKTAKKRKERNESK